MQAGARKVYAVEACTMALHCMELVTSNCLTDKVTVLPGKIEEVWSIIQSIFVDFEYCRLMCWRMWT